MIRTIKKYWDEKPLLLIILAGSLIRLVSVIFSKGWGMHDDHFLVIEAAQSWADGRDYNKWLPIDGNTDPPGHSFFYPGLHYFLFLFMNLFHISDPQTKMIFVRLLHAAFSLLVIYFGYKITEKISDKNNASIVGLLLALYWFMPFLSVRNLAEIVCIPLLLWAVFLILNFQLQFSDKNLYKLFFAGILLGLAFSVRYQTLIFSGGIIFVLLIKSRLKYIFIILSGMFLSVSITEGLVDYFVWCTPFIEIKEYIRYNLDNAYNYMTMPWYQYFIFILGILIPPVSFFLFIGFFRLWKKHLLLFLPSFLFLAFHSYFPNKQERFILTIIPFIIMLGVVGWNDFLNSKFKFLNSGFIKFSWLFFWILNLAALPVVSTVYSKKARVESMSYLSEFKNINSIVQEGNTQLPPRFYSGQWFAVFDIYDDSSYEGFKKQFISSGKNKLPNFVLFYEENELYNRVKKMKVIMPGLNYETTIEPGIVDRILYTLNPNNRNEKIFIYRNIY